MRLRGIQESLGVWDYCDRGEISHGLSRPDPPLLPAHAVDTPGVRHLVCGPGWVLVEAVVED